MSDPLIKQKIVACITDERSAWKVLQEATMLAGEQCLGLRLIICQGIPGKESGPEAARSFIDKIRHAAEHGCRESGVNVIIETLDCGAREAARVKKIIEESGIELLVLTDSLPNNRFARLLSRKAEEIARGCNCSVLLVR
ncbi:MAG TPA: universal stress protein [Candidatus Melainabacteria bacterium]|nr:universal stress protein [Candidatus Melainabacteria bacterium]